MNFLNSNLSILSYFIELQLLIKEELGIGNWYLVTIVMKKPKLFQVGNVNGKFDVVRYWNGVATEDETVVIAVKVNGKIEECIWTKQDGDDYSSEDRNGRDVEVSISEQDTLCKLKVKKANRDDHDGLWNVLLIGKCNDKGSRRRGRGKKRRKRQIVTVGDTPKISGAVNIGVLKRRGKCI